MIGAKWLTIETDPVSHKTESHPIEDAVSGEAAWGKGKGMEEKWQSSPRAIYFRSSLTILESTLPSNNA
jgi:hypothetical protein